MAAPQRRDRRRRRAAAGRLVTASVTASWTSPVLRMTRRQVRRSTCPAPGHARVAGRTTPPLQGALLQPPVPLARARHDLGPAPGGGALKTVSIPRRRWAQLPLTTIR